VADASATHACVLNKYPVVDDHLLLVTRRFEHQESPLTVQDFEALWRCLLEYPSLGFYNSGTNAGASQPHKHLQLVPLPMSSGGELFPMQRLLEAGQPKGEQVQRLDLLPFAHAVVFWNDRGPDSVAGRAAESLRFYHQMLLVLSIPLPPRQELRVPRAYNLLVTRRAMLLVPRRREHFRAISLNALAFAGAFLVPDEAAFVRLKRAGPMAALRWVAPRDTSGGAGRLK
jgi:ATP adenylyltransferase